MDAQDKPRILIISPIAVQYDAISNTARNMYFMLKEQSHLHVDFITAHNELPDIPARLVPNAGALLLDPVFRAADVIIYNFGIYHPLLDAVLVGNSRAKQVVHFHNITPVELVKENDVPLIERSFRQLHNLQHADRIWSVSQTNADVLVAHDIDPAKIEIVPLVVDTPEPRALRDKPRSPIEIVFVGRAVPAKGLLDGIEALGRAAVADAPPIRLSIVGNLAFSDESYIQKCRELVDKLDLQDRVTFCGTADDGALQRLYHEAHVLLIPTFHEGFCVPVVEALRAGCVPIGYKSGNMSNIVDGLGCLVATGDVDALSDALKRLLAGIRDGLDSTSSPTLPLDRGPTSVSQFDEMSKSYVSNFTSKTLEALTLKELAKITGIGAV
ncbi:MAG: glycosyltransferase family 4 protein [Hyphomicrobiaceae bacterium]